MHGPLTPLYSKWMNACLGGEIPPETEATCDQCAMCPSDQERNPKGEYFNKLTKCCTYFPRTPNYLIGMVLRDTHPGMEAARTQLRAWISEGRLNPRGLLTKPEWDHMYTFVEFGKREDMVCPFYIQKEGGLCGIWLFRPATCQTWFCKTVRGAVGQDFWYRANKVLNMTEVDLSLWCMDQLGLTEAKRVETKHPIRDKGLDDLEFSWGEYTGREEAFFIRCAELVEVLDWDQLYAVIGPRSRILYKNLHTAYHKLTVPSLPATLTTSQFTIAHQTPEDISLLTHSIYDPMILPRQTFDLLRYFDGRSVEAIKAQILADHDLEIPDELLQILLDFEVLKAAD